MPSSPQPSTVRLAHLHLELSFIILLLLLPFLILIITTGGLMDHTEESGVTDVEVVACAERVPPILERCAHLNGFPLLVVVCYLKVHWQVLHLA